MKTKPSLYTGDSSDEEDNDYFSDIVSSRTLSSKIQQVDKIFTSSFILIDLSQTLLYSCGVTAKYIKKKQNVANAIKSIAPLDSFVDIHSEVSKFINISYLKDILKIETPVSIQYTTI